MERVIYIYRQMVKQKERHEKKKHYCKRGRQGEKRDTERRAEYWQRSERMRERENEGKKTIKVIVEGKREGR